MKRGCTVEKRLESLPWKIAKKEMKVAPELSLEAEMLMEAGGWGGY